MLLVRFFVNVYYVIVCAWAFFYLFVGFTSNLPWADCGDMELNTIGCYKIDNCQVDLKLEYHSDTWKTIVSLNFNTQVKCLMFRVNCHPTHLFSLPHAPKLAPQSIHMLAHYIQFNSALTDWRLLIHSTPIPKYILIYLVDDRWRSTVPKLSLGSTRI